IYTLSGIARLFGRERRNEMTVPENSGLAILKGTQAPIPFAPLTTPLGSTHTLWNGTVCEHPTQMAVPEKSGVERVNGT
ncbi:hypothetical protein AVEN_213216-1, partial [Araneus ventricosus]